MKTEPLSKLLKVRVGSTLQQDVQAAGVAAGATDTSEWIRGILAMAAAKALAKHGDPRAREGAEA